MTLRLEPPELGAVQIRIDRPIEAPAHVEVSVTRPETLTLLLRDQSQLQHTLDQAGVPAEGRTLTFQLAAQNADSQSRQAGGFGQPGGEGASTRANASPDDATDADPTMAMVPPAFTGWRRAGLDITA